MTLILVIFGLSLAGLLYILSAKSVPVDKSLAVISASLSTITNGVGLFLKRQSDKVGPITKPLPASAPFRLAPSFRSGFLGGLIGGGLAGLVIGVFYYFSARNPASSDITAATWVDIVLNFSFASVCGAVFGSFVQFFIQGARHLSNFILIDVIGGVLGGALVGTGLGFWAALLFAERSMPEPDYRVVFGGGILCAVCIVLGVLLYDHKRRGTTVKRTFTVLLPVLIVVVTIGLYVLMTVGVNTKFFEGNNRAAHIGMGAKIGAVIGALWGLVLGGTLALYRLVFRE